MEIRPATQADAAAIAAIYNEGIAGRTATFEPEPRGPEGVLPWLADPERWPTLVAERDGRVVGWVRLIEYEDRCAYEGVGEYSLYVANSAKRTGIGRALMEALLDAARARGAWKVLGKLFTINEPSIALAHACGFRDVGVHLRHGRLDGEWLDVLVVERLLDDDNG